jgi:hypothetical protein
VELNICFSGDVIMSEEMTCRCREEMTARILTLLKSGRSLNEIEDILSKDSKKGLTGTQHI